MIIAVDDIKVGEDAVINITLPNEISNELVSVTIEVNLILFLSIMVKVL